MALYGPPQKFLVIDDHGDSRTFLTKTLLRKYPNSVVQECQNGDTAIALLRDERVSAVIAHRTFDYDGETLVRLLRKVGPNVPIVMVSGHDKRTVAFAAGADAFMHYDAWLTVGTVVAEAIAARSRCNDGTGEQTISDAAEPEPV